LKKSSLLFAILFLTGNLFAAWQQVFIPMDDKSDLQYLASTLGGLDHCGLTWSEAGLELPLNDHDYQLVLSSRLSPQVLIDDLELYYAERIGMDRNYGSYHTYSEGMAEINQLHNDFPSIVGAPVNIGLSIEGNIIWAFKISDNPEIDEDESEVFYNSYIHARESITIEVLLYFAHHLTDNYGTDTRVTDLVDNRELWFVPFMNPDGVLYNESTNPNGGGMWRKNRRNNGDGSYGVDLNRNYGHMWGYDNSGSSPTPSSDTYRGSSAFSELESQVIRDFVNAREFKAAITYHSYSNLYIYPYGYENGVYAPEPDHSVYVELTDQLSADNGYQSGTGWELLYPVNGDTDDWFYGDTTDHEKIIAITPEVGGSGDGFWPTEARRIPLCEENLEPCMLFGELAGNMWASLPPAAPVMDEVGTVASDYLLSWSTPVPQNDNPAVDYRLLELQSLSNITDDFSNDDNWSGSSPFVVSTSNYNSAPSSYYSGQANNADFISTLTETYSVQSGDNIEFQVNYDIENEWDYAYVEISTNGGSSWLGIEGSITTTNDSHGNNLGNGITGNSGGWIAASFDLNSWVGQTINIRLRYKTDGAVLNAGMYVDDFWPVSGFASEVVLGENITDEFYAISGQGAGEYFYKVQARDADGDLSLWSNTIQVISEGGEDLNPPIVSHTPVSDTNNDLGPWTVGADISDGSGIATASLEYRINGSGWTMVSMSTTRDTYSADIPGPAVWGSLIEYRINATDASPAGNSMTSQVWAFNILTPVGLEYCQDFEAGFDDFNSELIDPSGNDWEIATFTGHGNVAYISYSSQNQIDHARLISPAFDCSAQATVELTFWHHLKLGYSGAWTDALVWGSIDNGVTWEYLLAEWHEDDEAGEFTVEGDNTLDISSWAAGQSQVRISFEFADEYDWYWNVDDVCITGTLAVTPANVELDIYTNGNQVFLSWMAVDFATSYDIYQSTDAYGVYAYLANSLSNEYVISSIMAESGFYYRVVARSDLQRNLIDIPMIDSSQNHFESTFERKQTGSDN
jgi:hypothetical protein